MGWFCIKTQNEMNKSRGSVIPLPLQGVKRGEHNTEWMNENANNNELTKTKRVRVKNILNFWVKNFF